MTKRARWGETRSAVWMVAVVCLAREWIVKDVKGVPVLKDSRWLKWLFRKETESKRRSDVLILLTPTTVRPDANQPAGKDKAMAESTGK